MSTEAQHPDQLQPGHKVGHWLIVERGGVGGSSRVFKVERDGRFLAMKMALQSVSPEEESVSEVLALGLGREAAALFTSVPQPNLLRVFAVDYWWPTPSCGYPFLVTDWVDGDDWHTWRWRTNPNAATLVDTYSEVVRTVGELHSRGVHHRDLKAENLLVRREDGKPFLIDMGTVRLPGTFARTLGIPVGVMHLLPPELLAYARSGVWKQGVLFQGGVGADLYTLGALLYQSLCDLHPFDPKLSDNALTAAIATVRPTAPHLLNPRAPRALSDIAMRLLEKEPEARYANTDELLRALWEAGKERKSPEWRQPLLSSTEDLPVEATLEEKEARLARRHEALLAAGHEQPPEDAPSPEEAQKKAPPMRRAAWRAWARPLLGGLTLAALTLGLFWLASPTAAPETSATAQKGSPPMSEPSTPASRLSLVIAWLCTTTQLGCPAVQVRPPEPTDCPKEAQRVMFEELKVKEISELVALVDVNQPGDGTGFYRTGPVVGRITFDHGTGLVEGTLLYGYLWTGPGMYEDDDPAVIGQYTEAELPDGRRVPVCIAAGGPENRAMKRAGSTEEMAVLPRELPVNAVRRWR